MKLENELTVPASVEQAWEVLLDVERIAPCLPGARITGSEGDRWNGTMKVKIGPITATYDGTIEIAEADEEARHAVLRAQARDSRGRGGAAATITSSMEPAGEGTRVRVETDLRVTGPAAQFGRGVMQEVSATMMNRFADCLATKMGGPDEAAADAAPAEPTSAAPPADEQAGAAAPTAAALPDDVPEPPPSEPVARLPGGREEQITPPAGFEAVKPEPEPATPAPAAPSEDVLDLGELSRGAVLKRAAPAMAGLALLLLLLALLRRRGR